jgi:hypothetical protein
MASQPFLTKATAWLEFQADIPASFDVYTGILQESFLPAFPAQVPSGFSLLSLLHVLNQVASLLSCVSMMGDDSHVFTTLLFL